MGNITTASFGASRTTRTRPLYQWDYGQVLKFAGVDLPDAYTVHFANQPMAGTAKAQVGGGEGVRIPDEYLTTGKDVYAWLVLHAGEADGESVYMATIPVTPRPQPVEEEPTPVQQGLVERAIAALNAGVSAASEAAESARAAASAAGTASESWAVGRTGTRDGEDTDNARYYSELSRQQAERAGFARFDIDDATGELRVVVSDALSDGVRFSINEQNGELEVSFT